VTPGVSFCDGIESPVSRGLNPFAGVEKAVVRKQLEIKPLDARDAALYQEYLGIS